MLSISNTPSSINRERESLETPQAQLGGRRVTVDVTPNHTLNSLDFFRKNLLQTVHTPGGAFNPNDDLKSRRVSLSSNFRSFDNSNHSRSNLDRQETKLSGSAQSSAISKAILFYFQTERPVFSPQTSNGITQHSLESYKDIAQDIDYVIYSMPVNKNQKDLQENFLNPLVHNGMIPQNFIFKPLENSELNDALATVGFTPKKDQTGQVRPGLYFNESYKGTIAVSSRTTKEGDTEWNIFFKGVDPGKLSATGSKALQNICTGAKEKLSKFFYKYPKSQSQTRNISNNQVIGTTITGQMTEDENRNNASYQTATMSQHSAKNYRDTEKVVKCFIEVAERSQGENNEKIILTLAGHSMGGGLAQTGLAAYPDKIHRAFTFQAMDTKEDKVKEKIKNNPEIALKLRDFHTKGDLITGGLKDIRNSKRIETLTKINPRIRRTVESFSKDPLKTHQNFIQPIVISIVKSNPLIFSNPINSSSDNEAED